MIDCEVPAINETLELYKCAELELQEEPLTEQEIEAMEQMYELNAKYNEEEEYD